MELHWEASAGGPHSCGEGVVAQQGENRAAMTAVANHCTKALVEEVVRTEGQEEVHEAGAPGAQSVAPGVWAGQVEEAVPLEPPWELQ